ncbi:hypothetical protein H6P81_006611 [Aristolochia fimbriata]|uniref:Uncharacterized protein n=1 Tax=Aristolochia fimbriata TaxID=158543 RepID=A0AAV7F1N7_ARIFI|nr:hypothetical protein H6P81_006611 [Aristolochia fimbriata]
MKFLATRQIEISSYKKDELQTDELVKQDRASDPIPLLTEVAKEGREAKQNGEKAPGTGRASVSYISSRGGNGHFALFITVKRRPLALQLQRQLNSSLKPIKLTICTCCGIYASKHSQKGRCHITRETSMPTIPTSSTQSFDEDRWVIQIRRSLEKEDIEDDDEEDNEVAVSIFDVPKTLMANKPEAYVPQQVVIGPYHHWRPELYDMEQYKLSAAKKVQRRLSLKFHHLIDHLLMLEPTIRRCYHRYLDFNGETLCWGMTVDACFLLEFLRIFGFSEDKAVAGSQSSSSSQKQSDHLLRSMLVGFCKAISPFKIAGDLESINVTRHAHLLELVFFVIMPKSNETTEIEEAEEEQDSSTEAKETSHGIITLSETGETP